MKILDLEQIKACLEIDAAIDAIEQGYIAYSEKRAIVPPVGHLGFTDPEGDCHIKYGYIEGDDFFVIKVAHGFYGNQAAGLPGSTGMMLVCGARSAEFKALLLDDCYLTDVRTAIGGLIAARLLAPERISAIGIVGTGVQARMQLELLKKLTGTREVHVWGRSPDAADACVRDMQGAGFAAERARSPGDIADRCNLIVTVTAAREPLLPADRIRPGTHITAVGADAPGKQELDPEICKRADIVAVDSRSQCVDHGEVAHALSGALVAEDRLIELGEMLLRPELGRSSQDQVTVADLTGVAVQDIQIAKAVYAASLPNPAPQRDK